MSKPRGSLSRAAARLSFDRQHCSPGGQSASTQRHGPQARRIRYGRLLCWLHPVVFVGLLDATRSLKGPEASILFPLRSRPTPGYEP